MARKSKRGVMPMDLAANRRTTLTLFSNASCARSHRVRMVLAEKSIQCDIVEVSGDNVPDDLPELNPYNSVPTLVDRGLVLYDARVIMEYLDERFPHPPLMAVDPVTRAHARLALHRIEQDWYDLLDDLEGRSEKQATKARKLLRENLIASSDLFGARQFFLSDEFSLVDCSVVPILWRLPKWGIDLPPASGRPVRRYAERMFARDSFRAGMTELEREMRD